MRYEPLDKQTDKLALLSDVELVGICNDGDVAQSRRAFATIYRRYRDSLIGESRRYAPDGEAIDAVQDVFVALLNSLPPNGSGIEVRSSLIALLYVATRHAAISKRRQEHRRASLPADIPTAEVSEPTMEPTTVRDVSSELPRTQREVVLMRFVGGFQLHEIAETIGVPLGTVKSRLHNGITQMRTSRKL